MTTTASTDTESATPSSDDVDGGLPTDASRTHWTLRRRLGRATIAMAVAVVVIVTLIVVFAFRS